MEHELKHAAKRKQGGDPAAFHYPRHFPQGRSVYTVISPRARGLSIGVNLNPDRYCNFDCAYCEVAGPKAAQPAPCDVEHTSQELEAVLALAHDNLLARMPAYAQVPADLLKLREVALSGDGEPTACPNFSEVVASVIRIRAVGRFPFYKVVLITNASGLLEPEVQNGLSLLTRRDEIWAKLDAGTQAWLEYVNHTSIRLETILQNILSVARGRPVVIQSLFPLIQNAPPPPAEIEAYVNRLRDLRDAGAQISEVQVYSAHRPTPHAHCGHLPLRLLSLIARKVRDQTGLAAEVY